MSTVCLLGVGQTAWAADSDCKAARKHFRKSIWWFETERWDRSVEEAESALSKASGCDPGKLRFVVPYGRWRYDFNPEVYLGVAAAHSSWCEGERIEDKKCRVDPPLWGVPQRCEDDSVRRQSRVCERDYVRAQSRLCAAEAGEDPRCDPEVDWWLRLEQAGVGIEIDPSAADGRLRLARDAHWEERLLRDECAELWSVAPFLAEAILRRENPRRVACEVLVGELTALLGEARRSCDAGE